MGVYMPPGRGRHYKIRYDPDNFELLTDNGQPLTEEDVPDTQVRPIPPSFSEKNSYSVGDVVEFYDKGCWWLGTVIRVLHAAKYFLINYPHNGLYNEFYLSQLRDAKLWSKGRWSLLYSQQSGDVIYDGNCPMAENSVQTSVASTPGDMQTDVQSQQQPEHEVDKQRRQRGLIGTRVTLKAEECLHFQNAKEVIKDSRTSKFSNHENGLNNVEAMSRRSNLHVPHLKGVKRTYDKRDGTFSGIQNGKCNKVKWFKHGDTAEVIEQRIKTHERELQVYRSVLKAFYAQNPSFLSSEKHRLLTNLRIELHITSEENTRELRKVRYCLYVILGLKTLGALMENLYLVHPLISVMVLEKNHFRLVADL